MEPISCLCLRLLTEGFKKTVWLTEVVQKQARSEMYFVLYDKKMYPRHKPTESRPEIAFYYFFK